MSKFRRLPGAVGTRAARTFDRASSQRLSAGHLSALNGAAQVAVSLWVYPTGSNNFDVLFGQIGASGSGTGNTTGIQVLHNATDATTLFVACRNADSGPFEVYGAGTLTLNAWNHVFLQYDGTQGAAADRVRVYVGGAEKTPSFTNPTNPFTLGTTNQPFVIAADSGGSTLHWSGRQAQCAVWVGAVLSSGAIAALARGAHPSQFPTGLLECWDLDRVGPIVGLVRGTVLNPVNGGSLTVGPPIQGPPRRVWLPVGDVFGAGGATYSESVGMAAASALSPTNTAHLLSSASMDAGAATTLPTYSLSAQLAITLSQVASLAKASSLSLGAGVSLTADSTLPSSTEGRLAASVTMSGAAGITPAAVAAMVGSISLTSDVALSPIGNLLAQASALLEAAHSLGTSGGGPQTYSESVGMAAAIAAFTDAVLRMDGGVSLTSTSTLTPDAATRLGAIIALQAGAAIDHSALTLHQTAVSLTGSTGVEAASLAQFRESVALAIISTLNTAGSIAGVPTYSAIQVAVALLKMAGISPDTADIRQAGTDPSSATIRQAGVGTTDIS